MAIMYWAFFNASVVLAALTTLAYFLYTFNQYRAAHVAHEGKRRGKRGRAELAYAGVAAGNSPIARLMRTMSGYVASQTSQVSAIATRARGGQGSAVDVAAGRDFEVADTRLPVSPETQAFGMLGSVLTYLLAFSLAMAMIMRTVITGHAPWVNLYEASVALAEFGTLAYIYFELRYKTRALGVFVAAISLCFLLFAAWVGAAYNMAEPEAFKQITPALQDNPILTIHVSMMIVSYAFFIVGFACGVLMLVQGDAPKPRYAWLPSADAADELGYKATTVGFPLLALGIILGAWWANYAWGHYWSWDPKETSALITWLVYAIYLHARGLRGWRGKPIAWLLIAGFAATLFTYFGVSFIIPGLHSYGGVK